ncbi:MAG TPA: multiheme c-type cytochrome [Candidatus Eisenbacteria bacterium]|nr:multiheme c-type cytochrome [Candidatus Eisenbacteria bacterium]
MRTNPPNPNRILPVALLLALALGAVGYTPPPLFRRDVNLQSAETCKQCHLGITESWQRSAHSKAERSQNLLFGRMYFQSLKTTRGGTFLNCGPCHEATTYVNQDFNFVRDVSHEGVSCVYCHMVSAPGPSTGNPPFELDLGSYYGSIRNPVPTNSHKSEYSTYLRTSGFCGGCHAYKNQNGVTISDTYAEWKASKYAKQGVSCQTCHMPGQPGRVSYLGPSRPKVPDHSFSAEIAEMAQPGPAETMVLRGTKSASGDSLTLSAVVTNTGWGHSLPTGNDQNMVIVRIRVLTADGAIVWENDPFTEWNNSVFGIILEDELGNWPVDTWMATKVLQNRRIKAGASATARYRVGVGGHKGPYKVEAQLLFRRARPSTIESYALDETTFGSERVLAEASLRVP